MTHVDIYLEASSTYQGITDRKCSYVLSVSIRDEERTREGFGHFEGTYHQAVLITLAEALERMTAPCEICVHTRDTYVCSKDSKAGRTVRIRMERQQRRTDKECRRMAARIFGRTCPSGCT